MKNNRMRSILILTGLVLASALILLPVHAANGTISIAYRGSGGNYIGDTIIFDGMNTWSPGTVIRITGPGLPAAGVPVYDLNGEAGSGNIVPMNPDGSWKYVWYTSTIKGLDKLQTARYYITAVDSANGDKTATTSLMLKKPEFYLGIAPDTAAVGEYVQLSGTSEKGSNSVRIIITDQAGNQLHAFDSTVSASSYFNHGFHVDMAPGTYKVTLSSPSVKSTYTTYLTVVAAHTAAPTPVAPVATPGTAGTASPGITPGTDVGRPVAGMGSLAIGSSPDGATVYLDSTLVGTTPATLINIPPGNHLVELKKTGYVPYTVQIIIREGETTSMTPVLVRSSTATPVSGLTLLAGLLVSFALMALSKKRE